MNKQTKTTELYVNRFLNVDTLSWQKREMMMMLLATTSTNSTSFVISLMMG